MTIDDNSIFDTETPLKRIEPSRERVIVYTTAMEEGEKARFNEVTVGGGNTSGDDYSQYSKEVSVNYISNQTKNAQNEFPLNKGSTVSSLRNPDGTPAAITDDTNSSQPKFTDYFTSEDSQNALSSFKQSSDSQFLRLEIKKGKTNLPIPSVMDLYDGIRPNDQNAPGILPLITGRRLAENNLLSPTNKLISTNQTVIEEESKIGSILLQPKLGVHSPRRFPNVDTSNYDGNEQIKLSIEELKQLGSNILFAAGGDNPLRVLSFQGVAQEVSPGDFGSPTLSDKASDPRSLAKIGVKVPFNRFSPTEIVANTNPDFKKPGNDFSIKNEPNEIIFSNGSPYNPNFIFTNFTSSESASFMIGIISSVSLAIAVQWAALQRIPVIGKLASDKLKTFVITRDRFDKCVTYGIPFFFQELEMKNAGFNAAVARNIIRTLYEDLGIDNTQPVNPEDVANKVVNLNNSRIVNFVNVVAKIGDNILSYAKSIGLSEPFNPFDLQRLGSFDASNSYIDTITVDGEEIINPASLVKKTNLSDSAKALASKSKLAWGSMTTPSQFILPNSIITAEAKLTGNTRKTTAFSAIKDVKVMDGGRLPKEDVIKLEQILEASYVPFYFQDLRTNEIISFHAFLESLDDSFDASYSEDQGYGKADPVYVYKQTKRNIRVSFMVAALNQKDFDHMWLKINKLVTLLYPQYTAGRQLSFEGNTFFQPFSQIPASSPMIRLRVGDLLKSNYSDFATGRLFGIAQREFATADAQGAAQEQQKQEERRRRIIEAERRMSSGEFQIGEKFKLLSVDNSDEDPQVYNISSPDVTAQQIIDAINDSRNSLVSVGTLLGNKTYIVSFTGANIPTINGSPFSGTFTINLLAGIGADYQVLSEEAERVAMAAISIPGQDAGTETDTRGTETDTAAFLNPANNAIMKSFEFTTGKGLAGFIKNMSFDWKLQNGTWETDEFGKRAPKQCTISITFAPIFDIAPGLDSNGFMTAPVYPVGDAINSLNIDTYNENSFESGKEKFTDLKTQASRLSPQRRGR